MRAVQTWRGPGSPAGRTQRAPRAVDPGPAPAVSFITWKFSPGGRGSPFCPRKPGSGLAWGAASSPRGLFPPAPLSLPRGCIGRGEQPAGGGREHCPVPFSPPRGPDIFKNGLGKESSLRSAPAARNARPGMPWPGQEQLPDARLSDGSPSPARSLEGMATAGCRAAEEGPGGLRRSLGSEPGRAPRCGRACVGFGPCSHPKSRQAREVSSMH